MSELWNKGVKGNPKLKMSIGFGADPGPRQSARRWPKSQTRR